MCSHTRIKRKGNTVTVEHAGKSHDFRFRKGWGQLLEILRNPESIIPFKNFIISESQKDRMENAFGELMLNIKHESGISILGYNQADLFCDPKTVKEVKERLIYLIDREAKLRNNNDYAALDEILEEKDMLVTYLQEALSPTGRIRVNNNEIRHQKRNVWRRISRVIDEIGSIFPDLAKILYRQIIRGSYYQYVPSDHKITVL